MSIPTQEVRSRTRKFAVGTLSIATVVGASTALSAVIYPSLDIANVSMIYLAGVVYLALRHGLGVSIAGVLVSIFAFDLLFVEPAWGLTPINPRHIFTFIVMMAVGFVISHLASQARAQTILANHRAQRAQALAELAACMAVARTRSDIENALRDAVGQQFRENCVILPEDAIEPSGGTAVALRSSAVSLGWLWLPDTTSLDKEERELLEGLAGQASLALERCMYEQRSAESLVKAESERLRSTLLTGISHDFRSPLTTIVGAATSLMEQEDLLDRDQRRGLTRSMLQQARRLHRVMSDLLDMTRLQEGAVQLLCEWCLADELVGEAIHAVRDRSAGRAIRVDVPDTAIVWCDPRLVEQALVNLLDNSLRYTGAGIEIRVRVSISQDSWYLEVQDDGPGFGRHAGPDLFQKFNHASREAVGGGFGLGLAICEAVVRLHGGQIAADSPGGARVTMKLPLPPYRLLESSE